MAQGRKLTTEEFIEKAVNVHGDKYDYSLVEYIRTDVKVKIICKEHGVFEQTPTVHLSSGGCSECGHDKKRKTLNDFIKESKNIHGDKYDYSLVKYVNTQTKVKIICKEHGMFEQYPAHFLNNIGCPMCSKTPHINTDLFIERSKDIHYDKYDYSLVNYINNRIKVKIICSEHGVFEQNPKHHMKGVGCPKCANNVNYSTDEFIKRAKNIHGDKYDYSLTKYIKNYKTIKIICKKHGIFEQVPNTHLNGCGCPICKESKGEKQTRQILEKEQINFICQKKFDNLKNKNPLSYDFYLPEYNICIEYDGEQHFNPIKHFGGLKELKIRQKRDKIKTNFCKENGIKLLRIRYDEDINEKLQWMIKNWI